MKHKLNIAVIGGGFAGLTAAINLIKTGHAVTLFEASKYLGGRAFSFMDPKSKLNYDNGQHLLMGCYKETFNLLKEINALDKIRFLKPVNIAYHTQKYGNYSLQSQKLPAPFHLLNSFLTQLKPLTVKDRFHLIILSIFLFFPSREKLKKQTVSQWLTWWKQDQNAINYIWKIITESIMNADINQLNAYTFRESIRILFIENHKNIIPALSSVCLSDLVENDTQRYFDRHNAKLHLSTVVTSLKVSHSAVLLNTQDKQYEFDKVVLAIPHKNVTKLIKLSSNAPKMGSILSIHFTSETPIISEAFVGFPEQKIHWVFNKNKFSSNNQNIYSVVISNANLYLNLNKAQLLELFLNEMLIMFPSISSSSYQNIRIIHEKQATPILSPEYIQQALKPSEIATNIYVCGDWTDTGLPATIESASKSGKIISKLINKQ